MLWELFQVPLIQTKFLQSIFYATEVAQYLSTGVFWLYAVSEEGTYFHIFWTCPRVTQFWMEVFDLINTHLQLSLPCTPEFALLGIHDDEQRPRYTKLLISYCIMRKRNYSSSGLPPPLLHYPLGNLPLMGYWLCINWHMLIEIAPGNMTKSGNHGWSVDNGYWIFSNCTHGYL